KGDRIALLSENRPEWAISDLAAQALGLVNVSLYPSLPAEQIAYIVRDSGARALVLSDAKQRAKLAEIKAEAPDLQFVIAMDGEPEKLETEGILPFAEVAKRGEQSGKSEAELDALSDAVQSDAVATFIYTSGTTGDPKGAMLTHENLLQTPDGVVEEPI